MARVGRIERKTKETEIRVELDLDGRGQVEAVTGVPFLDHMLTLFGAHGLFDLTLAAQGDLDVDGHHTVEDIGLALGMALAEAVGDKAGITRYGFSLVPMDEALARAVIDLSGRPYFAFRVELTQDRVGRFETGLVYDFFQALAAEAKMTLHLDAWHGRSDHHVIEALFKAFGRALGQAVALDPRRTGVPSTKGVL